MRVMNLRLWLHWRLNPSHILVGWDGAPEACGTCLGLSNPENGLPGHLSKRARKARKKAVTGRGSQEV